MLRLLLVSVVVVAGLLLVRWLLRADPKRVATVLRRTPLLLGSGGLLLLAVTGRFRLLFALAGAAVPFVNRVLALLRYAPLASQAYAQYQNARGAQAGATGGSPHAATGSQVRSRHLHMALDHNTGELDGVILKGRFEGRRLSQLHIEELLALRSDYRAIDGDSLALLQRYLDRYHNGWEQPGGHRHAAADGTSMSSEEAARILGIEPNAPADAVVEAHRRLMQKLHPDRGGSDYLATKINQAKDVLLRA